LIARFYFAKDEYFVYDEGGITGISTKLLYLNIFYDIYKNLMG
jgi:hypothetical protein